MNPSGVGKLRERRAVSGKTGEEEVRERRQKGGGRFGLCPNGVSVIVTGKGAGTGIQLRDTSCLTLPTLVVDPGQRLDATCLLGIYNIIFPRDSSYVLFTRSHIVSISLSFPIHLGSSITAVVQAVLFFYFYFIFVYSMRLGVKTRLKTARGSQSEARIFTVWAPEFRYTNQYSLGPAEILCVSMGTKKHLDYIIHFNLPRFFCFVQF